MGAQDPVGEQAEGAEVGEAGALGEGRQVGQVQRDGQAGCGEGTVDGAFHGGAGEGAADGRGEGGAGARTEQAGEPHRVAAGGVHHEVGLDHAGPSAVLVGERDRGAGAGAGGAAGAPVHPCGAGQVVLDVEGEDGAVGAPDELPAVALGERGPAGGVAVVAVLEGALASAVEGGARGDDSDLALLGDGEFADHGPGGLAGADDHHVPYAGGQSGDGQPPEAGGVQHPVVVGGERGAGRPRPGHQQAPAAYGAVAAGGGVAEGPAVVVHLGAVHLAGDDAQSGLAGGPVEVVGPLAVAGLGAAPVDPAGVAAAAHQVSGPAVAGGEADDLGDERVVRVAPGGGVVGEAEVLLGQGAQALAAVGPAVALPPVGGGAVAFDGDHLGRVEAGLPEHLGLDGEGDGLGAGADHQQGQVGAGTAVRACRVGGPGERLGCEVLIGALTGTGPGRRPPVCPLRHRPGCARRAVRRRPGSRACRVR